MEMKQKYFNRNHEVEKIQIDKSIISEVIKPTHGTTTLSFIFKHGMVVAVDSRASAGSYIASQTVNKVLCVNKFLLATMAGGAADCQFWSRVMGKEAKLYELNYGKRMTTAAASKSMSDNLYMYQGYGLSVGSMICGWDEKPEIFYVDNDGSRYSGKIFSVGSGSTIAYGVLENEYRYDMEKDEAIALGKKAIFRAGHRDAFSGGTVNVFFMDENGWEKIGQYDVSEIFHSLNK